MFAGGRLGSIFLPRPVFPSGIRTAPPRFFDEIFSRGGGGYYIYVVTPAGIGLNIRYMVKNAARIGILTGQFNITERTR